LVSQTVSYSDNHVSSQALREGDLLYCPKTQNLINEIKLVSQLLSESPG